MSSPDDVCAHGACQHPRCLHGVDGERLCTHWLCTCPGFEERLDPSPPDGRGWDDSDDQGNLGGAG